MKLTHPDYHFEVSFAEDVFPVIVIERSDTFRSYVSELYEEIHGGHGKFVLSRDWKPLDITKKLQCKTLGDSGFLTYTLLDASMTFRKKYSSS